MSYNVINGLPTKFKYTNNMLGSDIKCNNDIRGFFDGESYKSARTQIDVGEGVENTADNRVDAFKDFMVQSVFRVADIPTSDSSNYVPTYVKNGAPASNSSSDDPVYYTTTDGHDLAGTIYCYELLVEAIDNRVDTYVYIGYLIEKTYINGEVVSSVDVKLRNDNPLMQTISDCTGNVYDFKKGVTFGDFSKYLRSTTSTTYEELTKFDNITPSNVSGTSMKVDKENVKIPEARYNTSTECQTNFSAYALFDLVVCSFCGGISDPIISIYRTLNVIYTENYLSSKPIRLQTNPIDILSDDYILISTVLGRLLNNTRTSQITAEKYIPSEMINSN